MSIEGQVIERQVSFKRGHRGRKRLVNGRAVDRPLPAGRIPRVSRLVALGIKLDAQIRAGELRDWADVARLARVTRARASQIAALTLLAPDIIEELVYLPPVERGRDPITERELRPISAEPNWSRQRRMWAELNQGRSS